LCFGLKTTRSGFRFGPQNRQLWFGDLAHKITATVSWFEPQNQVDYGLSVVPQNQREDEDGVRHASRSSGLLHLKVSRARISQSSLKIGRGVAQMVHVASTQRSCGDKVKNRRVNVTGCIGLVYLNFAIFMVLGHKGSLVISFPLNRTPKAGREGSTQSSLSHPLAKVAC
jgi:hypothetical protein